MNDWNQIRAFDQAGTVSLMPIYHLNARAIDALAPRGAHIVDLGSGSAQLLAYLADCRPDLRITGIDLAPHMVEAGNETLAKRGLSSRVQLKVGDMTKFRERVDGERVDLITSVFALHHLPAANDLTACMAEVGAAAKAWNARVWLFDFARPRRQRTARLFPEILTPEGQAEFKQDTSHSLNAAWSFAEMCGAMSGRLPEETHSSLARMLPLYQFHVLGEERDVQTEPLWQESPQLTLQARRDARQVGGLFKKMLGGPL
jgi:SAM-dependent methyltransferase